jgi:hypothetical protein
MTEERSTNTEKQEKGPHPWRPTTRQALWAIGLVVALVTITLLVAGLYPDIWLYLSGEHAILIGIGVALVAVIVLLAIGGASLGWTGFRGKTLWDLLQLLIVPLVLVGIGFLFEMQQAAREEQRAEAERELAEQRAQDEALQGYLDQMNTLLLEHNLRNSKEDSGVRTLARARTATVIQRLDADRNQNVIRFLKEANLTGNFTGDGQSSISLLTAADLQGARLEGVDLSTIDLSGTDLSGADLSRAEGVITRELEQQATPLSLQGATMPDGTVRPERYVTREFEPALSFTISDEEWEFKPPETPNLISFSEPEERRIGLNFISPVNHVFDPSNPSELKEVPAPDNAAEWASWFQKHPNLDPISKPDPMKVGGKSGMGIDVTYTREDSSAAYRPRQPFSTSGTLLGLLALAPRPLPLRPESLSPAGYCDGVPCVYLFPAGDSSIISYGGTKDRFIIVDVSKGETVIIQGSAPTRTFNEVLQRAQKVIDSVEWKGR